MLRRRSSRCWTDDDDLDHKGRARRPKSHVGGIEIIQMKNGISEATKLVLTNLEADGAVFREIRASYFPNKAALPASTLLQVPRLANPAYLVEIDVIAVLPPKA
jgi:hypothetical protein